MNLLLLFNLPSFLIVLGPSLLIGAVAGAPDLRKMLLSAKEVVLPVGVIGTLIGYVAMLSNLDDPSALGPAVSVALLASFYGVGLHLLLTATVGSSPEDAPDIASPEPAVATGRIAGAVVILLGFIIAGILLCGPLWSFFNWQALLFVFAAPLLALMEERGIRSSFFTALAKYSVGAAAVAVLASSVGVLRYISDPPAIGPGVALGLLGLFYGGLLYIVAGIGNSVITGSPFPFRDRVSIGFTAGSLLYLLILTVLLVISIGQAG
jgi:flagellar motor component MotA